MSSDPSPFKVLIVEENPAAVEILRNALEAEGYRVAVASDGAGALEQAARRTPGLVIQDLVLSDMDGPATS